MLRCQYYGSEHAGQPVDANAHTVGGRHAVLQGRQEVLVQRNLKTMQQVTDSALEYKFRQAVPMPMPPVDGVSS